jgi:uncharacterized membrane protein
VPCLLGAAAVHVACAFLPTMLVNVAMNEAPAAAQGLAEPGRAAEVRADHLPRWPRRNLARTLAPMAALVPTGTALLALPRRA